MLCPFCQTDNREDRETCYVCGKDISTVRLLANKARQHYNDALEHAERDRVPEAITELKNAIGLDTSLVHAHVVLGTLYARQGKFPEARDCWKNALNLNPEMARAHDYLERVESVQAALPTIKSYRRVALLLLCTTVGLAAYLIYSFRPVPGTTALQSANILIHQGNYGEARNQLEQATLLAPPDSDIQVAAAALSNTMSIDLQQRLRMIQDLKFRQLYPEALAAMADLEATQPDEKTSASLSTVREDISYYYRNMLGQLYAAYDKGDVGFEILEGEINRFLSLYPPSPERDEIQGYLARAQATEIQTAFDELRRRFLLDGNAQVVMENLAEIAPRFENYPAFPDARKALVEEVLSSLFNQITGYLEQEDYQKATDLLASIEAVTAQYPELIGADISSAIELGWNVLRDARRQYMFREIEKLIDEQQIDAAEDAIWDVVQEPDLSPAETGLIRSYWRRLNQRESVQELLREPGIDRRYYNLEMDEAEASSTLELYGDVKDRAVPRRQLIRLTGLAAASAFRLNLNDEATSLAARLRTLDEQSTVTARVRQLLRNRLDEKIEQTTESRADKVRVEPARPREIPMKDTP